MFICIKMDLALNKLHWLMYHKTKTNPNEPMKMLVEIFGMNNESINVGTDL